MNTTLYQNLFPNLWDDYIKILKKMAIFFEETKESPRCHESAEIFYTGLSIKGYNCCIEDGVYEKGHIKIQHSWVRVFSKIQNSKSVIIHSFYQKKPKEYFVIEICNFQDEKYFSKRKIKYTLEDYIPKMKENLFDIKPEVIL